MLSYQFRSILYIIAVLGQSRPTRRPPCKGDLNSNPALIRFTPPAVPGELVKRRRIEVPICALRPWNSGSHHIRTLRSHRMLSNGGFPTHALIARRARQAARSDRLAPRRLPCIPR